MKAVTTQLQSAAAAGHSTAVATLATVTAAMQATWDPERGKKVGVACMPVLRVVARVYGLGTACWHMHKCVVFTLHRTGMLYPRWNSGSCCKPG